MAAALSADMSAFRRLQAAATGSRVELRFTFDGTPLTALDGDSIAAALLAAGVAHTRLSPVSGRPRAPYCLMGTCFECLLVVDDVPDVQGCMTPVREGMRVQTQREPVIARGERGADPWGVDE